MPLEPHWLRPAWLWALPPLALVLALLARRVRRARRWEGLVDPGLRPFVLTGAQAASAWPLLAALAAGWLLLVLALAGPAWQLVSRPVFRIEQPRVLLLDLSRSMQAEDAAPSRLARARFEVMDLLRATDEGQFALIAFGAEPFLITPLTSDAGTILEQVPLLEPAVLPVEGQRRTDLALVAAARLLERSSAAGADDVLIADAVAPEAPSRAAAAGLAAAGHRVSVLAVAPDAGLADLAAAGGGVVLPARADDLDTARLLALQGQPVPDATGERVSLGRHWRDEGAWLLLLTVPLSALAFRRGWLALLPLTLVLTPPAPAQAELWSDLWLRPPQRALRDADAGRLDAALAGVEEPRWQAALRYRAGDYVGALAALAGLDGAEDHYNRGNVLARLGRFDDALGEYDTALELAPNHADALHNRRLLAELMRRPQPPPVQAVSRDDDHGADGDRGAGGAGGSEPGGARAVPLSAAGGAVGGQGGAGSEAERASAPPPAAGDGAAGHRADAQPAAAASAPGASEGSAGRGLPQPPGPDRTAPMSATAGVPDGQAGAGGAVGPDPGAGPEPRGVPVQASAASDGALHGDAAGDAYLLQQVPDDPSRLLRERLMLQYLRRHGRLY